jgi:hypothetical protein
MWTVRGYWDRWNFIIITWYWRGDAELFYSVTSPIFLLDSERRWVRYYDVEHASSHLFSHILTFNDDFDDSFQKYSVQDLANI